MRVLSTELPMISDFNEKGFYELIIKWLNGVTQCKSVCNEFEACENKSNACFEDTCCKLETFTAEKDDRLFYLFKLEQKYANQIWISEIILKSQSDIKRVFFHIDCNGDATDFDEIPDVRTDVIRCFVNSAYVKQPQVKISQYPITVTDDLEEWVATAVTGERKEDMPIVLVTQFFDNMGYAVDEYSIAKKLAGVAYVVTSNSEATRGIKCKAGRKAPFNGTVAIYTSQGMPKVYRQENAYYGMTLDKQVLTEVQRCITAKVDAYAPSWKALHSELLKTDAEEKKQLLDIAFDENISLEEQVKRLQQRVSELEEDKRILRSKNETLEIALKNTEFDGLLIKAPIPEHFAYEQHDLLVKTINKALSQSNQDSREYELYSHLLEINSERGEGREIFDALKNILSDGHDPKESDLKKLRALGFEIEDGSKHYKLKFHGNEKYCYALSKTPSDHRAGKNLFSDINKKLNIYK